MQTPMSFCTLNKKQWGTQKHLCFVFEEKADFAQPDHRNHHFLNLQKRKKMPAQGILSAIQAMCLLRGTSMSEDLIMVIENEKTPTVLSLNTSSPSHSLFPGTSAADM